MYTATLDNKGLWTFPNDLSKVPTGGMLVSDNTTNNKDGTAETRRGIHAVGSDLALSTGEYINNTYPYQDRLVMSASDKLYFDSTGDFDWTMFSGTFAPPTGIPKIHSMEASKNLYLTSSIGVYKMDAFNAQPVLAGVVQAVGGTTAISGTSGFLGTEKQAVYQVVWGYTDANNNLHLGAPSERMLIVNTSSTDPANVTVEFVVPEEITSGYFWQLYRTPQTDYSATPADNIPPGAELQLAFQQTVSAGELSSRIVTYTDITTDDLLGATGYWCPSQEGAAQYNNRPPLCKDMCVFNGMSIYLNYTTLEETTFNLISVGSPDGIQVGDTVVINGVTFTGAGTQDNAAQEFEIYTSGTVAENIDVTARNLAQCISANVSTTSIYAFYTSGYNDLPGRIVLQANGYTQGTFYVTSSRGGAFQPELPASGTTFASTSDTEVGSFAVSKLNQPEAVPTLNTYAVCDGTAYRCFALRDRAIILTSVGVYTVTGDTPGTLQITLLDGTVNLIAIESATLLNNSVYCLTNQGVAAINEGGVTIKSRPIEFSILETTAPQYTYSATATHSTSYESERIYILWTVTQTTDTVATQGWVYNWITDSWSRWPLSITSGVVNPADNKLYCGNAHNPSFIYQERKTFTVQDYVDDTFDNTISASSGATVTLVDPVSVQYLGAYLNQEDQYSIITAIDPLLNTVTVEDADIIWDNASCAILTPIPAEITWAPFTSNYPHFMKNYTRIKYWFKEGNFETVEATFVTDISPNAEGFTISLPEGEPWGSGPWGQFNWGGTSALSTTAPTLVPRQKALGHWIMPGLSLSFPYAKLACEGCTLTYDVVSDVVR